MTTRIIVFRVDASLEMGTGHVMRCLTLASALRDRGCDCRFICRDHPGNLNSVVRGRGFKVYTLPAGNMTSELRSPSDSSTYALWLGSEWQTDAAQVRSAICNLTIEWLVVDHYAIDFRWEKELRPFCGKLMVIDDLADREHDCDLLLDQNLVEGWQDRYRGKVPANSGMMLGPEYALLQPLYAELHDRIPPREGPVRRIIVYFGGADTDNLTGMSISAFTSLQTEDVAMDVVINPSCQHAASVRSQAEKDQRILIHEGLPSLAPLMVKADLAIGAAGATSWERCCLGLPSLVITLADNQKAIAERLDRAGLAHWIGQKNNVDAPKLAQALQRVIGADLSPEWSRCCTSLVDGKGVERVAGFALLDAQTHLRARLARLKDETKILQWANDPLVRMNAFRSQSITPVTHRKWFYERLRNIDNCQLYIVETENGIPIGQVRFEKNTDSWELSYSLDSCARSRGLGKHLLQTAISAFLASIKQAKIMARVKDVNIRSCKVLSEIDFKLEKRTDGIVIYSRKFL